MIHRVLPTCLIGTLLATVGAAPADSDPPPPFEPDVDRAGEVRLEGATWAQVEEDWSVLLREVGDEDRLRYIVGQTGIPVDPFAAPPGADPRYLTYLLVIENRADHAFGFNALDCWLKTNREEILTPIGLSDLSFDYQLAGAELPASYERIASTLLEGAVTVESGRSISGLLIYHVPHPRTKRFHIEVDLIPPSGDLVQFVAQYQRTEQPKKKKAK